MTISKNSELAQQALNIRREDYFMAFHFPFYRLLSLVMFLFCASPTQAQESQAHDWENPEIIGINKEKTHATIVLPSEKAGDPRIVSLNGLWRFK